MSPYDEVEDAGSRAVLLMTHDAALAQMAEHERRAEEFGFETYGAPAEEAASYNRHPAAHSEQVAASLTELRGTVGRYKRRRDGRVALAAAGCLLAWALLWVAAVHWWWPL